MMASLYSRRKVELIYAEDYQSLEEARMVSNTSRCFKIVEEDTQPWGLSVQLSTKVCSYVLPTFCGVHEFPARGMF